MFIELHNISRSFGDNHALVDVNLTLERGRIGLLGPNGAGKSTLMKILLGLLPPTSGTGRVLDHDLATAGVALRRAIGYMPEADALIPGMQGAEYVALAGELYGMSRMQALRRAHEVLTCLDLDDARYRLLEEYSTGMKQRLKLAQALVHDPPVLLLDEPTSGMDPAGREGMLDLLVQLGRDHGKAILLSTHLLGDIDRVCDAVVILHQGRILCQGPVDQLCRSRHDRYRLLLQGDPNRFLEDLRLEGVQILHDNGRGEYRVQVPAGWTNQAFFKLAQLHQVVVRGLQSDDEDLEELFHRVIQESGARSQDSIRGTEY
ncbi:MAG: ABC transporter ATP-binding protein [Planctomycetes bacterium]|nr:ABC transporter ATP-binding protein [Planctomycetota bacterium]